MCAAMERIALVTGATSGIGKVTARALAQQGYRVVLLARDARKAEDAAAEVRGAAGHTLVETLLCDLSVQAQIRAAAEELKRRHDRLHVLVNNAGAIFMKHRVTPDGIEQTFAVDHLAYFLLTNLLLDVLEASAPARVVNVASAASVVGHIDFDDLQSKARYKGARAYANAKLANILFSNELARRLAGTGVTSNALHPGAIASQFGQNDRGIFALAMKVSRPFLISEEKGARTSIYLATSPEVEGVTGQYFVNCKSRKPPRQALDEGVARRLWEVSAKMTGVQLALTEVKAGAPDTRRAAST
jgi:NAD(P)-dependent dehydrogenase (short-subunit alcohol dehydrogenase family)